MNNDVTIRAGILGLGMAGNMIVRSMARTPGVQLAAAADLREHALSAFRDEFGGRMYGSLERLIDDPDVDAVWIASPSHLHAQHAIMAMDAGKHVVVEKPFATSIEECDAMIEASKRNNVALIAGGARGFEPAVIAMRGVLKSGRLGQLRALTDWSFTSFMTRARERHEIDQSIGGGTIYNQGPHVLDVLRLLGGGMVRSVRASMVDTGLQGRPCAGYITAFLEFEDGVPATFTYDGYGYVQNWEFLQWGETPGRVAAWEDSNTYRRALRNGTANELEARELLRYAGRPAGSAPGGGGGNNEGWVPGDYGIIVATCDLGEIRQSRDGLYVYDDDGRHDEPLPTGATFRGNEVGELVQAINGVTPVHDGTWAKATIELVLAVMESAETHREVVLKHQVPVRD